MHWEKYAFLAPLWGALAVGCFSEDPATTQHSFLSQPIKNGSVDTTTDAVMALGIYLSGAPEPDGVCSGTVVAVKGNSGYYLTAAHCVGYEDGTGNKVFFKPEQLRVIAGADYLDPAATSYVVEEVKSHPFYDGAKSIAYDFAMIRFAFSGDPPAFIPAMTPEEDDLKEGSQLDVIGYGWTEKSKENSKRHHAVMKVSAIVGNDMLVLLGPQDNVSSACPGDSGGPGIAGSGANKRVATVSSVAQMTEEGECDIGNGLVRVSKVYDSFIKPFLEGDTGAPSCSQCSEDVVKPGGKCTDQLAQCSSNASCQQFLSCVEACGQNDSACFAKCDQKHKEGSLVYSGLIDCVCDLGCPASCGIKEACNRNVCGFAVSPQEYPGCNVCVELLCCDVDRACFEDVECNSCVTSSTPGAACSNNPKYKAFLDCVHGPCGDVCGSGQEGGAGGTGGAAGSAGSNAGGSSGSGQAGSGDAGQAGSGDAGSGTAGSGTAAGGTESGTAGSNAGGSGGAGTSNPVSGTTATEDDGCGCQVPGTAGSPPGGALALFSAVLGMLARRRRASC